MLKFENSGQLLRACKPVPVRTKINVLKVLKLIARLIVCQHFSQSIDIIEALSFNIVYIPILTVAKEKQSSRTSFGTIKALTPKDGCLARIICAQFLSCSGEQVIATIVSPQHNHELT